MSKVKIYTCGKMSGLTPEEQMCWRRRLEESLNRLHEQTTYAFIHPPLFYNYETKLHKSEHEVKEWELSQVCNCDIVVANLNNISDSIGSHFELGATSAINLCSNKHIYVIGICDNPENLHPWLVDACLRIEKTEYDAAKYIAKYLLV